MSQGRLNLALRDIARAKYLIKAESASVHVLYIYPLLCIILAPTLWFDEKRVSTAKEQVIDHQVHYRLFNLSLYLAVHPGINQIGRASCRERVCQYV